MPLGASNFPRILKTTTPLRKLKTIFLPLRRGQERKPSYEERAFRQTNNEALSELESKALVGNRLGVALPLISFQTLQSNISASIMQKYSFYFPKGCLYHLSRLQCLSLLFSRASSLQSCHVQNGPLENRLASYHTFILDSFFLLCFSNCGGNMELSFAQYESFLQQDGHAHRNLDDNLP